MIVKFILNVIGTVITILINIVNIAMPTNNLNTFLVDMIETILTITQQSLNFMYFIFGETIGLLVPVTLGLLLVKYTIGPIVMIVRAFFINTSE